ncbi:hypothetical protein O7606_13925 [Micromonospora sp. WMMD882]|uniref:hypothetical protein n=1 Tax=Micromonospora sp. WMMD882 TaxID=3015151 RepID=UPI00248B9B6C|nr:hypothetical protein [Micromonospora sp. WMMD882]WBB77392.1 hypothetical protein O7606_13925 [Micromonospora sp. WMMD882]
MTRPVQEPAEAVPANPFKVPGLMRDDDPLNPVKHGRHESFYVPVDNSEAAFEQCVRAFQDPSHLDDMGRLVLVAGHRGCGKSALVNRCAHWLRGQLAKAGLHGEVIDATKERREPEPMADRRARVCAALMEHLYANQLLVSDGAYQARTDPDAAYRTLASCLTPNLVPIVLLPPATDVPDELVTYAADARKKIIFLAETSYEVPQRQIDRAGPAPAVHLAVGPLGERDAGRFAEARLQDVPAGLLPRVAATTLDEYTRSRGRISIGEVQRLLYGLYEKLRVQPERPDEVTLHHISLYILSILPPSTLLES